VLFIIFCGGYKVSKCRFSVLACFSTNTER